MAKKVTEKVEAVLLHPLEKDREIEELNRKINGYKGQVRTLQNRIADLENVVKNKNEVIDNLSDRLFNTERQCDEMENKMLDAQRYAVSLEDTIEKYEKPWWKRIFG